MGFEQHANQKPLTCEDDGGWFSGLSTTWMSLVLSVLLIIISCKLDICIQLN